MLKETTQNFKVPFRPPKIAVCMWLGCQSYNLITSFTQQKLILADFRGKKNVRECVRKKFFETILGNSHKWKTDKNGEGRKQLGPWPKPRHLKLLPTWCCCSCHYQGGLSAIYMSLGPQGRYFSLVLPMLWHNVPIRKLGNKHLAFSASKVSNRHCCPLRLITWHLFPKVGESFRCWV